MLKYALTFMLVSIRRGFMNIVLSVAKLGIGITCHSTALIADAGHSLSDLFSDVVTLWAVHVARLPPDHDHPQGHGKFEAIGALFLSLTLIVTSLTIGMASNTKLLELLALTRSNNLASFDYIAPSLPALFMAVLSIVSKEWLFRITRKVGQQLQSTVVIANAWHHRSDAYSSVLAAGSIGLAMYVPGFIFADAAAGLFVAAMIGMTGMEILGESVQQLTDTATIVAVDGKSDSNAGAIDVRSIPTENVINGLIQTASLANEEGALPALSLQEAGAAQSQWPMPKIEETSRGPAEHPASSATTIVEAHVLKEILRFGHNDVVVCRVDARETESDVGGRFNSATGSNARRWTTDVTIRFPKEKKVETTISMAFEKAKDIRHSLENSSVLAIDNVRVYLDLNGE